MRARQLFILTHVYGMFAVWHLCCAVGCALTTALLFAIPAICVSGTLLSFTFNKWSRPTILEKMCVLCLVTYVLFFNTYLVLCKYSPPEWVWYNNIKSGIFIAITIIFYCITYYKFKREQQ